MELTERQREILNFILEYQNINDSTPQPSSIAKKFDISRQAVNDFLRTLEKKGWISRIDSGNIVIERDLDYNVKWLAKRLTELRRMRDENLLDKTKYDELVEGAVNIYKNREEREI